MASEIEVKCELTDCAFFRRKAENPSAAFCTHREKKFYMKNLSCPLFKMGWDANADAEADLTARFAKRR